MIPAFAMCGYTCSNSLLSLKLHCTDKGLVPVVWVHLCKYCLVILMKC